MQTILSCYIFFKIEKESLSSLFVPLYLCAYLLLQIWKEKQS